jgi:hypothetical protein
MGPEVWSGILLGIVGTLISAIPALVMLIIGDLDPPRELTPEEREAIRRRDLAEARYEQQKRELNRRPPEPPGLGPWG